MFLKIMDLYNNTEIFFIYYLTTFLICCGWIVYGYLFLLIWNYFFVNKSVIKFVIGVFLTSIYLLSIILGIIFSPVIFETVKFSLENTLI